MTPTCDSCRKMVAVEEMVYVRLQRPSDHSDLSCVLAGCAECFEPETLDGLLARAGTMTGGQATAETWEQFIESPEAARGGWMFIS